MKTIGLLTAMIIVCAGQALANGLSDAEYKQVAPTVEKHVAKQVIVDGLKSAEKPRKQPTRLTTARVTKAIQLLMSGMERGVTPHVAIAGRCSLKPQQIRKLHRELQAARAVMQSNVVEITGTVIDP